MATPTVVDASISTARETGKLRCLFSDISFDASCPMRRAAKAKAADRRHVRRMA